MNFATLNRFTPLLRDVTSVTARPSPIIAASRFFFDRYQPRLLPAPSRFALEQRRNCAEKSKSINQPRTKCGMGAFAGALVPCYLWGKAPARTYLPRVLPARSE